MKTDLTNLAQLRQAALAAQGLTAEVAAAVADAIAEVAERLPMRRKATLKSAATSWAGSGPYTQTVSVEDVRADEAGQRVEVVPASASLEMWEAVGVKCTKQGAGTLTFTAQEKPGGNLSVYVILQEVGE